MPILEGGYLSLFPQRCPIGTIRISNDTAANVFGTCVVPTPLPTPTPITPTPSAIPTMALTAAPTTSFLTAPPTAQPSSVQTQTPTDAPSTRAPSTDAPAAAPASSPIIASSVASVSVLAACAMCGLTLLAKRRRQAALARACAAADAEMRPCEANGKERVAWDFFISHVQAETKDVAADLYHTLRQRHGLSSWLDVKMADRSVAAMEDGVRRSGKVLVIVSLSYFSRPFCVKELRWAQQYDKEVVVAIPQELKSRIGEILQHCPDDLKTIGDIDFKTVDRSDVDHFELAVTKLIDPRAARRLAHPAVGVASAAVLFDDDSQQPAMCTFCRELPPTMAARPCGHCFLCAEDAFRFVHEPCPICQEPVDGFEVANGAMATGRLPGPPAASAFRADSAKHL